MIEHSIPSRSFLTDQSQRKSRRWVENSDGLVDCFPWL